MLEDVACAVLSTLGSFFSTPIVLFALLVALVVAGHHFCQAAIHPMLRPCALLCFIMLGILMSQRVPGDCESLTMHIFVVCGALLAASLSWCYRPLPYVGIGLLAGYAFSVSVFEPLASVMGLMLDVVEVVRFAFTVLGAVIMYMSMPPSVASRTKANNPSFSTKITLPFLLDDVFSELLNPDKQLGVSPPVTFVGPISKQEYKGREVLKAGVKRKADIGEGTVVSELLAVNPPTQIVWKQLETSLKTVNMHGGGKGDEPGVAIMLREAGRSTELTFQYYFAELSDPRNWWSVPKFDHLIQPEALKLEMTEQMRQRGYSDKEKNPQEVEAPETTAVSSSGATPTDAVATQSGDAKSKMIAKSKEHKVTIPEGGLPAPTDLPSPEKAQRISSSNFDSSSSTKPATKSMV